MVNETSSFPQTDWSLIRRVAGDDKSNARRLKLDELLNLYLPPMRRYLRHRFRLNEHETEDWVQGFITSVVLQSPLLTRADEERGKFRSFLSKALRDYGISELRRRRSGPGIEAATDPHAAAIPAQSLSDPAMAFDRHWAEYAIAEALRLTEERLYATDRGPAWEVFRRRLLDQGEAVRHYGELTAEFGFETPTHAATALNTAKRIFRRKLQDTLIEFGASPGDLPAAIAELKKIFQK